VVGGEAFPQAARKHGLEGIVTERFDRPYLPGERGAWVKTKWPQAGRVRRRWLVSS
jgi:ATP-dependent DNA ligase